MSKKSKKEAEEPDAFITYSDKLIKWVEDHHKTMLIIFGVLVVGGALIVGVRAYSSSQEMKAMRALYQVEKQLDDKIAELEEAYKKKQEDAVKDEKEKDKDIKTEPLVKTPELLKEKMTAEVEAVKSFIAKYSGKRAAIIGRLTLAQTYADFGVKEGLVNVLQDDIGRLKEKSLFYGLIHQRLGSALVSLGDCEKANEHFSKVVDEASLTLLHPEATLNMALCFEKLNETDKAKEYYKKVADEYSETDAGRSAKAYSRLIQLKALRDNQ